ncbi:MAG: M23 family metallopeptidase [Firmicutes bacterium]|nr:M23 family metallopeptidase [Bacillota bacterium]
MKKTFAPLAPLKKVRFNRKTLVLGSMLLIILLFAALIWRGVIANPFNRPVQNNEEINPPTTEEVNTEGETPPVLNEEEAGSGEVPVMEEETTAPVLSLPQEPMIWPLEGTILAEHHQVYRIGNTLRAHVGVDIKAEAKAEIKAAWPGVVDKVTEDSRLGWLLEIRHGGSYITQYANLLEEPYVEVGDEVKMGAAIGKVGSSAKLDAAEGNFLHFAIYRDGEALDPVQVISPR